MRLSVVIPIFNEAATVGEILHRIDAVQLPKEITAREVIAVNDASTDGTTELLGRLQHCYPYLKVVHHKQNAGKGAALRTGIALAAGDIILFQDADLEYNPADYGQLLRPLLVGNAADGMLHRRYLSDGVVPHLSIYSQLSVPRPGWSPRSLRGCPSRLRATWTSIACMSMSG
jgi:glycosyltransferase involved in cell wall biosynthesis